VALLVIVSDTTVKYIIIYICVLGMAIVCQHSVVHLTYLCLAALSKFVCCAY
jgi:hypothetical protein